MDVDQDDRWWIFDRPVHRDRVVLASALVALATAGVFAMGTADSTFLIVYRAVSAGWLAILVLGSIREFVRGRAERS